MKHKYYIAAITAAALLLTGCQQTQTTESEQETSTQTSTETQMSVSESTSSSQTSTSTVKPVTEVSGTTQVSSTETGVSASEVSSTAQTTTKTQSSNNSSTQNQPDSHDDDYTFRLESIGQPDNMSVLLMADRTADGFGCLTYNYEDEKAKIYYHHFSEDLKTATSSLLTIPEKDGYHFVCNKDYYLTAFDRSDIWAFAWLWSDTELKTFDPDLGEERTVWGKQFLLCHYDKNGSLLSTDPVNYFKHDDYLNIKSFDCVGGALYMTMSDGRILQFDKDTAEVTLAADIGHENYPGYNEKYLCFDRDNKPLLIQKKTYLAPDYSRIDGAAVLEFDLTSGSSGQTLYTIDEELDEISFLKGIGEYRFFINTYRKFIGVKDNGEQVVLIDIETDNLEKRIMRPDDYAVPYTNNLFDINIIPIDDSQYFALYRHYPELKTEAYRLTRKN